REACRTLVARAVEIADYCAVHAAAVDRDDAFPDAEFRRIAEAGLLAAPLPRALGGMDLGIAPGTTLPLLDVLMQCGRGNLAVGRLYEGHVNALHLLHRFGSAAQLAAAAADVHERGALFGVWNTEAADGVRITSTADGAYRLAGSKTFASGAGHLTRPLVNGALPDGGWQMCLVPMESATAARIDPSSWHPLGMRASASYRIAFDGVALGPDALIGAPGDYYRQPMFSGGAIRFAAVQLGGAMALLDATRAYLRDLDRTGDPYQRTRVGEMAIGVESGALWLRGAAALADRSPRADGDGDAERFVAYVNMARTAIERICLDAIRLTEQTVGARGLLPPHPFERIIRDLTLYLRQPAPDAALASAGRYVLEQTPRADQLWGASDA
nr:acyl-CoA/acyl-ACP dehydrogenase [Chloroflexota bacterium]